MFYVFLFIATSDRSGGSMLVRDAIQILQGLPQDAVLVANSGPMVPEIGKGSFRPGALTLAEGALVDGFSAEELKREEHEFFVFERSNLVILGLVRNSEGTEL
jgi:hypothetical protein